MDTLIRKPTNLQRTTLVAFLCYFVMSGMLAPIGIVSGPMAERFGQPVSEITRHFSWLTVGNFIGAVLALVILDRIPLRRLFLWIYGSIAVGLLSLGLLDSLAYAAFVLGVAGVGSGIGLAAAALTVSRTHEGEQRASTLVLTDGCFSIAGFVCGWLAAYFMSRAFGWSSSYQFVGLAAAAIVGLSAVSRFPATSRADAGVNDGAGNNDGPGLDGTTLPDSGWPPSVWLCVAALFLYTLGQYSMLFWLPNHVATRLGVPAVVAGSLVGQFWLGMFLAQVFVAWWVFRVGLRRLVVLAATTTLLASIPLWIATDARWLQGLALLWGLANLSMLKVLLSFATTLVPVPGPRLVSVLLLGATLGTASSPALTSLVVELSDSHTVLVFSTGCYVALLLLVLLARRLGAHSKA